MTLARALLPLFEREDGYDDSMAALQSIVQDDYPEILKALTGETFRAKLGASFPFPPWLPPSHLSHHIVRPRTSTSTVLTTSHSPSPLSRPRDVGFRRLRQSLPSASGPPHQSRSGLHHLLATGA